MSNTTNTWLDGIVGTVVRSNGVEVPKEGAINFTGSVDVTDDSANGQTTVNVRAGAATSLVAASTFSTGQVFRTGASGRAELAAANLRTVPFEGIALAGILTSATGAFLLAGPVPFATHNLGAGVACAVGVNASGVPVRATDATCVSAPNWLGRCNTDGSYTIAPQCKTHFDPIDFGAAWDGLTDDKPALDAMMLAVSAAGPLPGGAVILLPHGTGYCAGYWDILRPVEIVGRSAGETHGGSGLEFQAGYGPRFPYTDGATHNCNRAAWRNTSIFSRRILPNSGSSLYLGSGGTRPCYWAAATYFRKGDVVFKSGAPGVLPDKSWLKTFYRAANAGVSGNSTPAFTYNDPPYVTSYNDGAITWVAESVPQDYTPAVQVTMRVGDRVMKPGDTRHYWEVDSVTLDAKTSGDGIDHLTPGMRTLSPDGHVTFKCYAHSVLVENSDIRLEDNYIYGFTNYGILNQGGDGESPPTVADSLFARQNKIELCGGGIAAKGYDAQGGVIQGNVANIDNASNGVGGYAYTILDSVVGTGAHGFWGDSLGNTWVGNYTQAVHMGQGTHFTGDSDIALDNKQECSYRDTSPVSADNVVSIVPVGSNAADTSKGGVWIVPGRCSNLTSADYSGNVTGAYAPENANPVLVSGSCHNTSGVGRQDLQWFGSQNEHYQNAQYFAWTYQLASGFELAGGGSGTGWYSFGAQGAYHATAAVGVSGQLSGEGPGHWRLYRGQFVGTDQAAQGLGYPTGKQYRGVDSYALIDPSIKGGRRDVGDQVLVQSAGAAGVFEGSVIKTQGYRGHKWNQASTYTVGYKWGKPFNSVVEATANPWPLTTGAGTEYAYQLLGGAPTGNSGAAATATASDGTYSTIGGLTGMTSGHVGNVLRFSGSSHPDNNGLFVIQAYTNANTVTVFAPHMLADTGLTWTEYAAPVNSGARAEPTWGATHVTDGGYYWEKLSGTPSYNVLQFIDDPNVAIEPRTHIYWAPTGGKASTGSASIDVNTITNTANQTLATLDLGLFNSSGNLTDNASYHVEVLVMAKSPAAHTEAGSCKLSGDFYIDGGNLVRIGTDANNPNFAGGSTCDLSISGKTLLVRATPGINASVHWNVTAQVARKVD